MDDNFWATRQSAVNNLLVAAFVTTIIILSIIGSGLVVLVWMCR